MTHSNHKLKITIIVLSHSQTGPFRIISHWKNLGLCEGCQNVCSICRKSWVCLRQGSNSALGPFDLKRGMEQWPHGNHRRALAFWTNRQNTAFHLQVTNQPTLSNENNTACLILPALWSGSGRTSLKPGEPLRTLCYCVLSISVWISPLS